MVRPLKPENEISESAKYLRKMKSTNPVKYTKYLSDQKQSYWKNKAKRQLQKKIQMKMRRDEAIVLLGSKCASCGEIHNSHARIANLQFDHKFYIKTKNLPTIPFYAILKMRDKGIDPNTQFMLLCRTCHMAITYLRKNPEKTRFVIKLATQQGIIK